MNILTKEEIDESPLRYAKLLKGSLFIYPTDTIYGIGCDATSEALVRKIRLAKNRSENPFSIIVPSKDWIFRNCYVDAKAEEWIGRLPGPYTLILKLKNSRAIAKSVNSGMESVGIRIPANWFSGFIEQMKCPIVTTSVNKSGEDFMTSLEDMDQDIKKMVSYVIYEGPKAGKPSTIVHLDSSTIKIKRRQ